MKWNGQLFTHIHLIMIPLAFNHSLFFFSCKMHLLLEFFVVVETCSDQISFWVNKKGKYNQIKNAFNIIMDYEAKERERNREKDRWLCIWIVPFTEKRKSFWSQLNNMNFRKLLFNSIILWSFFYSIDHSLFSRGWFDYYIAIKLMMISIII